MKLIFSVFMILSFGLLSAQKLPEIRFEVIVPGTLKPLDKVYLAGSFNGWNEADSSFLMKEINQRNHWISLIRL